MEKLIIWSNADLNATDYADYLNEYYPTVSDETEKYKIISDLNDLYFDDALMNLNIQLPDEIIVIANLGLWNGRSNGLKFISSGNIADCLHSNCDYCTWYLDRYNFCFEGSHHDGTNYYTYRTWKDNLSQTQKENFINALYSGKINSKTITYYTKSIRPFIKNVYGL